jgi:hypothetical protein
VCPWMCTWGAPCSRHLLCSPLLSQTGFKRGSCVVVSNLNSVIGISEQPGSGDRIYTAVFFFFFICIIFRTAENFTNYFSQ